MAKNLEPVFGVREFRIEWNFYLKLLGGSCGSGRGVLDEMQSNKY